MIATLHIPLEGDDGYTLTLNDEGRWVSSDWPQVADALNKSHAEIRDSWSGRDAVSFMTHDEAKRLGGEILYLRA